MLFLGMEIEDDGVGGAGLIVIANLLLIFFLRDHSAGSDKVLNYATTYCSSANDTSK